MEIRPVGELGAAVEGDGTAGGMGKGAENIDQPFHDGARLTIVVAQQTVKRLARSTSDVTFALPNLLRNWIRSHSQWPSCFLSRTAANSPALRILRRELGRIVAERLRLARSGPAREHERRGLAVRPRVEKPVLGIHLGQSLDEPGVRNHEPPDRLGPLGGLADPLDIDEAGDAVTNIING